MFWKDDEDETYSMADHRYFEHADHGKQEIREVKAGEKGELLKLQRQVLRGQVNEKRSTKAADRDDAEGDQKSRDAHTAQDATQPFHTQTLKEKEKQAKESPAHPDAEKIIDEDEAQAPPSDEEVMSEPG